VAPRLRTGNREYQKRTFYEISLMKSVSHPYNRWGRPRQGSLPGPAAPFPLDVCLVHSIQQSSVLTQGDFFHYPYYIKEHWRSFITNNHCPVCNEYIIHEFISVPLIANYFTCCSEIERESMKASLLSQSYPCCARSLLECSDNSDIQHIVDWLHPVWASPEVELAIINGYREVLSIIDCRNSAYAIEDSGQHNPNNILFRANTYQYRLIMNTDRGENLDEIPSQLNGNNGEWTNDDDIDQDKIRRSANHLVAVFDKDKTLAPRAKERLEFDVFRLLMSRNGCAITLTLEERRKYLYLAQEEIIATGVENPDHDVVQKLSMAMFIDDLERVFDRVTNQNYFAALEEEYPGEIIPHSEFVAERQRREKEIDDILTAPPKMKSVPKNKCVKPKIKPFVDTEDLLEKTSEKLKQSILSGELDAFLPDDKPRDQLEDKVEPSAPPLSELQNQMESLSKVMGPIRDRNEEVLEEVENPIHKRNIPQYLNELTTTHKSEAKNSHKKKYCEEIVEEIVPFGLTTSSQDRHIKSVFLSTLKNKKVKLRPVNEIEPKVVKGDPGRIHELKEYYDIGHTPMLNVRLRDSIARINAADREGYQDVYDHFLSGYTLDNRYKPYIPVTPIVDKEAEEQVTSIIPTNLLGFDVECHSLGETKFYSLVTDKYAYNTHGLFRLIDGQWAQIKYKGGESETFSSLNITPIENQRYTGACSSAKEKINLFTQQGATRVVINPIQVVDNFVVSAVAYRYFRDIRTKIERFFNPGYLYVGYTEVRRRIYVLRPLMELLKRRYGSATNELIALSMFTTATENCESPDIAVDTCLYFFESKVLAQHSVLATNDAQVAYSKEKWLFRQPRSGISLNPFKHDYDVTSEGPVDFTSREEAQTMHKRGLTVVQREEYTECSKVYGDIDNKIRPPGKMLEPLNDKEAENMLLRGVRMEDPYMAFDYYESNVRKCHQSACGGFATTVAVINHLDTKQNEMAHSRILFSRDDELEQRYRASRYWDEVLNMFISLQRSSSPKIYGFEVKYKQKLSELVAHIRRKDPKYIGGEQIYRDWEDAGFAHQRLPVKISLQAFTQACIHHVFSSIELDFEDLRRFDSVKALEEYIEYVGAKLPLRRKLLDKVKQRMLKSNLNKVNLVQCKPHEFQKYKYINGQPELKYARDVVSITDEDWLAAKPELMAYAKKMLEGELKITRDEEIITISYDYHGTSVDQRFRIPKDLYDTAILQSHPFLIAPFYYKSIISDTSLQALGDSMTEISNKIRATPNSIYVITHGDDQLCVVNNTNPYRFGGKIGVIYIEGDINDNDGSHVDQFYRLDFATFIKRGECPTEAFSQLANPLMIVNPNKISQYAILRRRHGMQMCSGSVHTTYGNSKMSMNVGLTLAFSYDSDDYTKIARGVGMSVTSCYGDIQDVTFLSKNFYYSGGVVSAYTDLASLLRKIGRCTGDVLGSSKVPIDIRFDDHNSGVVKGWVHEPESKIVKMMRARYIDEKPSYKKCFGHYINGNIRTSLKFTSRNIIKDDLTEVDHSIIRHYYPDDLSQGYQDYQNLLNMIQSSDTYGVLIKSKFIDRIMKRRYGMVPVLLA